MKPKLITKLMRQFGLGMIVLVLLATPLFYLVTVHYYAEDLADVITHYGINPAEIDLKEDTVAGLLIQQGGIILLLFLGILLVMKLVPQHLWAPFNKSLEQVKRFKVEEGRVPELPQTDIREFDELNVTLTDIMRRSVSSFQVQKEFTENASHELQTPLAVVKGKMENLLQDPNLSEQQADTLMEIDDELSYMSALCRNLLLLSKIENSQFKTSETIDLYSTVEHLMPHFESIAGDRKVKLIEDGASPQLKCNPTLFSSMLGNLVINAIRHSSHPDDEVEILLCKGRLEVSNCASDNRPLDPNHIFERFYHTPGNTKGHGLGLAIVKKICDYHHWRISYRLDQKRHVFEVDFA